MAKKKMQIELKNKRLLFLITFKFLIQIIFKQISWTK